MFTIRNIKTLSIETKSNIIHNIENWKRIIARCRFQNLSSRNTSSLIQSPLQRSASRSTQFPKQWSLSSDSSPFQTPIIRKPAYDLPARRENRWLVQSEQTVGGWGTGETTRATFLANFHPPWGRAWWTVVRERVTFRVPMRVPSHRPSIFSLSLSPVENGSRLHSPRRGNRHVQRAPSLLRAGGRSK